MITTVLDDLEPADLGLPPRFVKYRAIQREMSDFGVYGHTGKASKRFVMIGAPTGSGKSAVSHTIGIIDGRRYAVVTATRGLEDQQVLVDKFATRDPATKAKDFLCFNIRGRANYECRERQIMSRQKNYCDDGYDRRCDFVGTKGCTYGQAAERCKDSNVLTNYQFWMNARSRNRNALDMLQGTGRPIELVIFDEFHLAPDELSRFLGVWIRREHFNEFGTEPLMKGVMKSLAKGGKEWAYVGPEWAAFMDLMAVRVRQAMDHIKDVGNSRFVDGYPSDELAYREDSDFRTYDELLGKIARIQQLGNDGNWIWKPGREGIKFDCVWPYRYAEQYLFQGVPKVVGMSATLRPKCPSLLGLARRDYDFKEWPRVFPPHLSPIYYWPLGRMGKTASEETKEAVYAGIDELWRARNDRKMTIHSVSYALAETFQIKCKDAGRHMILSKPGEAMIAFEKFRLAGPGAVLSSPSFVTGWDMPDDICEVNVIPKIPFSYMGDSVFQARQDDPTYEFYKVAQDVVQACGRPTRHEEDRSETFILDQAWARFQYQAKEYMPLYFKTRKINGVPKCPPKM